MKWCKAWPEDCLQLVDGAADGQTVIGQTATDSAPKDGLVLPKALVQAAVNASVEASVESLLKNAFPDHEDPEPPAKRGPDRLATAADREAVRNEVPDAVTVRASPTSPTSVTPTSLLPVWVGIGIVFVVLVLIIQNLAGRLQTLEAYMHGRFGARPY